MADDSLKIRIDVETATLREFTEEIKRLKAERMDAPQASIEAYNQALEELMTQKDKLTGGNGALMKSYFKLGEELRRRGHVVKYSIGPYGGYQAIWRDPETGVYWGASEFRKDGQAAGY